jgi:hypothetical protein
VKEYNLEFKPTNDERREHVERMKGMAQQIADKVTSVEYLEEWERDFISFALREWADAYRPKRPRGQAPEFSHVDAALSYVLRRESDKSHVDALAELSDEVEKSEVAVWNAIRPLLPDAYAHLELKPKT